MKTYLWHGAVSAWAKKNLAFKNNSFINQGLSGIKGTITKHDQRPQLISTLNMVYELEWISMYIFNLKKSTWIQQNLQSCQCFIHRPKILVDI